MKWVGTVRCSGARLSWSWGWVHTCCYCSCSWQAWRRYLRIEGVGVGWVVGSYCGVNGPTSTTTADLSCWHLSVNSVQCSYVPADDGSTAGFLFKGVALGCGDGEVLTTIGGSPSQRIAMPYVEGRWDWKLRRQYLECRRALNCNVSSSTCCMELLASMLRCAAGYDAVSWKSKQHSREPSQGSSLPPEVTIVSAEWH